MSFTYIDPPFNFNSPILAPYPPEITGNHLLKSMAYRLGWVSFAGRRLLDIGCGVRFARTIANLEIDLSCYVGVDVHLSAIEWLQENLPAPKFRFAHLDFQNPMYNPGGVPIDSRTIAPFAGEKFDAACMFSVITHQDPTEAAAMFSLVREKYSVEQLYFTAFIDDVVDGYIERRPDTPRLVSTYNTGLMTALLSQSGWRVERFFEPVLEPVPVQQAAFVCAPV